jgi:hypothetical protein
MYPGMGESLQFRGGERDDVAPPQLEPLSTSEDAFGGCFECSGVLGQEQSLCQFVLDPPAAFPDHNRRVYWKVFELVEDRQHESTPSGAKAGKWGVPGTNVFGYGNLPSLCGDYNGLLQIRFGSFPETARVNRK